jgi:hypothetical protein
MIRVDLDDETQIAVTIFGLIRAINYTEQWQGKWAKPNYQTAKQQINFPQLVDQQSDALGAEVAVAKYFKQPIDLSNLNYKTKADVGHNIEVKHTKWKDGSLILRDHDRKEDIAILVTGSMPRYYLCGWIPIAVARRPSQKRNDGAWWIGQQDLHPMGNLVRSMYANQL